MRVQSTVILSNWKLKIIENILKMGPIITQLENKNYFELNLFQAETGSVNFRFFYARL